MLKFRDVTRVYKPKDIVNDLNIEYNFDISYKRAWKVKQLALESNQGCPIASFVQLPYYCYNLKLSNENMVTHIDTDNEGHFKMLFIGFGATEVIEFSDSYKAPLEETAKDKGLAGEVSSSTQKNGRTMAITAKDMQKRKNDVKARTTLLLALPDEHQLRFSKYDSTKEFTNVAAASLSYDTVCAFIATQQNGSQIKYEDISQIDDDDIEEMDIKWNLALECRSPRSQDRGKRARERERERESYKKDPKVEEPAPKAMISIDGIGWDWSYMAKEDEASKNHALVADEEEVPTEYALMAKSSSSLDNEGIPQDNIDDKGYWDSGCSRHMTGNISYLYEYEPFYGGYVSFGHGRENITGKGSIKTGKLEFENVYFVKELKYNLFSVSLIRSFHTTFLL
nr:transposase, MuDR, MULE transposase domain protein [Tanacetum cinerariifolium]